jgi:hypothetical protein
MESDHRFRHRVGVVSVCLIALLTAREGRNLGMKHPPPLKAAAEIPHGSELEEWPTREVDLQPFCALPGNVGLPCCEIAMAVPETSNRETSLNPDAFPQAWDFAPETKVPSRNMLIVDEPFQRVGDELARDIWDYPAGWWTAPLRKCSIVVKEKDGVEYCAEKEPTEEVPEPESFGLLTACLLMTGALATVAKVRGRAGDVPFAPRQKR